MNNIINYRAWDMEAKQWRDIRYIEFWEGGMSVALWDGLVVDQRESGDGLVLCQFTGLRDKNGRKIYERDVVEHHKQRHVIEWDADVAGFSWKNLDMQTYLMFRKFTAEHCEVVGSILEDSTLMAG